MGRSINRRALLPVVPLLLLLPGRGQEVFAQADKLVLQEAKNFRYCQETSPVFNTRFSVAADADLSAFEAGAFRLEFGDGNHREPLTAEELKSGVAHTYTGAAEYTVRFSGKLAGGTVVSKTYQLKALNIPRAELKIQDDHMKCLGSQIPYTVVLTDSVSTTQYILDFDDGTGERTYSVDELKRLGGKVAHTYTMSYCDPRFPETGKTSFQIKLKVRNECGYYREVTVTEFVTEPLSAAFTFDQWAGGKLCTFEKAHLRNLTSGGNGTLSGCNRSDVSYTWIFSDGTTSTEFQPDIAFGEPGSHNIKLIATNAYECASDSATESILIVARTQADFTIPADTICAGTTLKFTNKSFGDGLKPYSWSVVSLDGGRAPASPGRGVMHPEIAFTTPGRYRVTLDVGNDCSNDRKDTVITVRKDPEVTTLSLSDICPPRLELTTSQVRYAWNGNTPAPEWSVAPGTGFSYAEGTGPGSEFPVWNFDTPGEYTLTVALKTVGCPSGALSRTAKLRVRDPKIVRKLSSTATDICEEGAIPFTSTSTGQDLVHAWSLSPSSNTRFINGSKPSDPAPVVQFDKFGDYRARLTLSNKCSSLDTVIPIHVRKEPMITFFELKAAVCPDEVVDFRNNFIAHFYNNPETATWSVSPATGFEYRNGTDAASAYPVIQFRTPGTYTFHVELAGVGCPVSDLVQGATSAVKVRNSAMTLSLEALETSLCEGDNLDFSMLGVSGDDDALLYQWSVVPGDPSGSFGFDALYGADKSRARIEFRRWGTYRVRGEVRGYCGVLDSTVTVIARKSPEVRLRDTAGLCPGSAALSEYVSYVWYNNLPKAVWEIAASGATPADGFAYAGGTDANTLYPQIDFKKKGEYAVRVSLPSVGCEEKFLQASQNFLIYDTAIVVEAGPVGSTDICEGTEVAFRNLSTGEGLTYRWAVERSGGTDGSDTWYAFTSGTGAAHQAPVIRFDRYGDYTVTLSIDGTCNRKTIRWPITVRGVPVIDLEKRMKPLCAGQAVVDLKEYIAYTDLKNNDMEYYWSVSPSTGVSFQDGKQDTEFPVITFSQHNPYTVKLEATSQCGPAPWMALESRIDVLDGKFRAVFETDTTICLSENTWLDNRSEGDSLRYRWSVAARTASGGGWALTGGGATAETPGLEFSEIGFYDVTLSIENLCGTDDTTLTVRAFSVPEIEVRDISGICEPFLFRAADRVVVRENNDPLRSAEWSVEPGGESDHFNSSLPYPEIRFPAGEYKVRVQYRNSCSRPGTADFTVRIDTFVPVTLPDDTAVCVRTEPFRLTASPDWGVWKSADGKVIRRPDGYYLNPDFSPYFEGEIPVVYELQNGVCLATDTLQVYIRPLPRVSAGDTQRMCLNHEPLLLTGGTPSGGYWSSADQPLADGRFPAVAAGSYPVVWHYADLHRCMNTDTAVVTVHPLPLTGFAVDPQPCADTEVLFEPDQPENLFRWNFGDGSGGEHTGPARHTYTESGFQEIRAEVVSVHGCVDSAAPRRIEVVRVAPPAFFGINALAGCDPFEVSLSVDEAAYADNHNYLSFHWEYGDGTTSDTLLPVSPRIYRSEAWDTTFTISFTVGNKCAQSTWDTVINVGSRPKASFALQHRWECSPVPVEVQNTTTGNRSEFSWDMGDGTLFGNIRNPQHEFSTNKNASVYAVTLTAINPCGRDTHTEQLVIKPRTLSAHFTPEKTYACVGEELHFRNNSTDTLTLVENTWWDFGDGSRDSLWHVRHAYRQAGVYPVRLWIENGCGFDTITDRITVYPPPELAILGDRALCEDEAFRFAYRSDQLLKKVDWDFGDGRTDVRDSLTHRYTGYGNFRVTLTGVSAHMSACRSSVSQAVEVYNKPIVSILPADTAACTPFLYKPEVLITGHASLLWDFGDQPGQGTLGEHRYTNDTYEKRDFVVKIHAETDKGCTSEYERGVSVRPLPSAGIQKRVTQGKPEKVLYLNVSREAANSSWLFPDGNELFSSESVEVAYDENGRYTMGLIAWNAYGCPDTTWLEHKVLFRGLHFPNTFIPHSRNAKNSLFNGIGMSLSDYHLEVYDQYQNKIWESRELLDGKPSGGWDGTNAAGERMPQGIYLWRAKAIFLDDTVWTGDNNDSGVVQTVQGTVLLLRE